MQKTKQNKTHIFKRNNVAWEINIILAQPYPCYRPYSNFSYLQNSVTGYCSELAVCIQSGGTCSSIGLPTIITITKKSCIVQEKLHAKAMRISPCSSSLSVSYYQDVLKDADGIKERAPTSACTANNIMPTLNVRCKESSEIGEIQKVFTAKNHKIFNGRCWNLPCSVYSVAPTRSTLLVIITRQETINIFAWIESRSVAVFLVSTP